MTAVVTMAFVAVETTFAVPPIGAANGFAIGFVMWFMWMNRRFMLCWCFVEPFILNLGKNIFVVCLAKYMGKCEITVKPLTYLGNKYEKLLA